MKATNKNPFKSFNPQANKAALLLKRNMRTTNQKSGVLSLDMRLKIG